MTRLLITFTLIATLLLGCADQPDPALSDGEGLGTATEDTGSSDTDSDTGDADAQTQEVTSEATESPAGESGAQPLPEPVTGTLGRDDVEGGCVYVEAGGERYELVAGPGATIVVDPGNGEVADTEGQVIAQAGDTIVVEGSIDPGMASFCQIGQILIVQSITAQ